MLELGQAAGFLIAAVLVTVAPGPDNLMVLGLGMARGRRRGMAFGLGCAIGCLSHTILAAIGVSAVLAASPIAFLLLKLGGGLYLIWLGIKAVASGGGPAAAGRGNGGAEPLATLFVKGLLANAVNPKVILFFLAFLPQFVDAERGHAGLQTAALGLLFTAQAALVFATLGYFAGTIGQWLARRHSAGTWLDRVAGGVFILLGLRLIAEH